MQAGLRLVRPRPFFFLLFDQSTTSEREEGGGGEEMRRVTLLSRARFKQIGREVENRKNKKWFYKRFFDAGDRGGLPGEAPRSLAGEPPLVGLCRCC